MIIMRLYYPFDYSLVTQSFGQNANSLYASQGLKGHTGDDYGASYGAPIPNCAENAYCYATINRDNPDPSLYRAVYTLVEGPDWAYEVSYGHCNEIYATVGETYAVGQILASMGNTGPVYQNGVEVTKEAKLAGSHAGAHLHFQVRKAQKESTELPFTPGATYLYDGHGVLAKDGYRYLVPDYTNGFNGCVSPEPFYAHLLAKDYQKEVSLLYALVKVLTTLLSLLGRKSPGITN